MTNHVNITKHLQEVQLVYLANNETICNITRPYIYWETNIIRIQGTPHLVHPTNYSFEQIHVNNINTKPLELLQEQTLDNHVLIYSIFSIVILSLICIISCLVLRNKLCKKIVTNNPEPSIEIKSYPKLRI